MCGIKLVYPTSPSFFHKKLYPIISHHLPINCKLPSCLIYSHRSPLFAAFALGSIHVHSKLFVIFTTGLYGALGVACV